jgi:hypothetical protein
VVPSYGQVPRLAWTFACGEIRLHRGTIVLVCQTYIPVDPRCG